MLIGIEATRANKPMKTGVEWYAWHVIQELKQLTKADPNSWILYGNAPLAGGLEVLPENWYEVRLPWLFRYGWTQIRLSFELYRRPIDVMWLPGSTLPRVGAKHTVVTCHDIGFHRFPELYPARQVHIHEQAMKEIARRADRIMTVSEFSAHELVDAYKIDPGRIAITPCGIDHTMYRPLPDRALIEECLSRHHLVQPFFVIVGRLETKKNIETAIEAFTMFKARRGVGDPHRLVLVGIPGHGYERIRKAIDASNVRADIVELGYVPEVDLPCILNAALAFIHPAKYEGFGIPPIQAMACGCPVIVSNAASLPEVCGQAALYASPDRAEEFIQAMNQLADDSARRLELGQAGIRQAQQFTWRRTAEQTFPVLTQW